MSNALQESKQNLYDSLGNAGVAITKAYKLHFMLLLAQQI